MRVAVVVSTFLVSQAAFSASISPPRPAPVPIAAADLPAFEFDALPLSDLVRLVYLQAYPDVAYTLDPQLLQDKRLVSFRWTPKQGNFRDLFVYFLRSLGYSLVSRNKVDVITVLVSQAPPSVVEDSSLELFIYRPKFRDGSYLVDLVSSLFSGKFSSQRRLGIDAPKASPSLSPGSAGVASPSSTVVAPGSLLDQADRKNDQLIFSGTPKEVAALRKLLSQVDVDVGQVMVSAALYEVQSSDHEGSAIRLASSLLGGKFQFSAGAAQLADNFVGFKSSSVSLLMQVLDSDSRFKVLSSPSLRVRSGESASITVGQDVPVLGAITYPQGSASPVQSVEMRSSGVLFSISPELRDGSI